LPPGYAAGAARFVLTKLEVLGRLSDRFDLEELNALAEEYQIPESMRSPETLKSTRFNLAWGTAKEGFGVLAAIDALEEIGALPTGFRIAETGFTSAASTASARCGRAHQAMCCAC
jgi:hypothetical protein